MQWTKPAFEEIVLGMEVTGYVNTDTDETVAPRVVDAARDSDAPVGTAHSNT